MQEQIRLPDIELSSASLKYFLPPQGLHVFVTAHIHPTLTLTQLQLSE